MKILVAMDSFKGSLSTNELSCAVEQGIYLADNNIRVIKIPIADGGEGTCATLLQGVGGTSISLSVKGPLFEEITASYGILKNNTAVIEMAAASGLPLVPEEKRNPMTTTTYGVGQMIKDAMERGCQNFIIGIGGSATNDGGIGMLEALGYRFLDSDHKQVIPVGRSLVDIVSVDGSRTIQGLDKCRFLVACDVENPLFGETGAAFVFGPQKGADETCVRQLDQGLQNWARVIEKNCGKSIADLKGAGAAGGLGAGFSAFLNAELRPGVDIIFDQLNMASLIKEADLIFTGEGRLDFQSVMGKAPLGIAKLCARYGKPVIALAGSVTDDAVKAHAYGMTAMFSIIDGPMSLGEAMDKENACRMVKKTVYQIMRLVNVLS